MSAMFTAPLLTGTAAQEGVETDRWSESNLNTTKINNKLLHFLRYKERKTTKMLNSATSYSPSLPEAGTDKCSLMNQMSSEEITMSVTELYVHNIFGFKAQQRKGGWLTPKVSSYNTMHVVGGFRHSGCRKWWHGALRRPPCPTSLLAMEKSPSDSGAWKLCHLFSLEKNSHFSICIKSFSNRRGLTCRLCNSVWYS